MNLAHYIGEFDDSHYIEGSECPTGNLMQALLWAMPIGLALDGAVGWFAMLLIHHSHAIFAILTGLK
jgi:hypothetical protein